jgi:thiamine biosynthesis protein ThiS
MHITLNGNPYELQERLSFSQFVKSLGYEHNSIAIAADGKHIPRSEWDKRYLETEQSVEIIAPMQGG